MGDRKKGKGKMIDVAPTEHPSDLPENYKYNMSWRDSICNKFVLLAVTDQGALGSCWSITFTRMIAAHLYIHDKVGKLYSFSSKHLFGNIEEKFANGFLKNCKGVNIFLKEKGLILEQDCKCLMDKQGFTNTVACNKVKGRKVFKIGELIVVEKNQINETEIIRLLATRGPITASIAITPAYKKSKKDEIYFGPGSETNIENHLVLLSGYDTENGVHVFKFQNSWGQNWGDAGFGRFARKISLPKGSPSLISEFIYPKLLDQILDAQ